MKICTAVNA